MPSISTDRRYGVSGNLGMKSPCVAATVSAITLSGLQTIDGYATLEGDRILVKDQADTTTNGIYVASENAWKRDYDFDGVYDITQGTLITVANGTINSNFIYQISTANPITIGTSHITFAVNNTASVAASGIHGAVSKTTPTGNDELPITDSASSYSLAKLTFTNLVAYLSGLCSAGWNAATATKLSQGTQGYTLVAEQATTSGTSIDFTNIPAWATKIWIMFRGVSTSGASGLIIQTGPSGGIENTGYLGWSTALPTGGAIAGATLGGVGFGIDAATGTASSVRYGTALLVLENAAAFRWSYSAVMWDTASSLLGAGSKANASALSRIRITTVGGTDAFDAGAIAIAYE